jgi:hypothetical protein
MAVYTTSAKVQEHLDSDWVGSGSGQVSTAQITSAIADATEFVQAELPNYWPFPDVAATPATPLPIQRITAMWAAAICYQMLHMSNHLDDDSAAVTLKARCLEDLKRLREGEAVLQRETISAEAIDWGDDDPVDAGLHLLTKTTNMDVIRESVTITGYELGVDFDVRFDPRYRGWVLIRINSAITDGEGGSTVTYDCTYIRLLREVDAPRIHSIRMTLG